MLECFMNVSSRRSVIWWELNFLQCPVFKHFPSFLCAADRTSYWPVLSSISSIVLQQYYSLMIPHHPVDSTSYSSIIGMTLYWFQKIYCHVSTSPHSHYLQSNMDWYGHQFHVVLSLHIMYTSHFTLLCHALQLDKCFTYILFWLQVAIVAFLFQLWLYYSLFTIKTYNNKVF